MHNIKAEDFNTTFEYTVRKNLKFYNLDQIHWVELPKEFVSYVQINLVENPHSVEVVEFCDYFDLSQSDTVDTAAIRLGQMCASTYNALVGNAKRKFGVGVYITELFMNNVKANLAMSSGPSVADPCGSIPGWAAYRFKFAAGN